MTRRDSPADVETASATPLAEWAGCVPGELELIRAYLVPAVRRAQEAGPLPALGSAAWVIAADTVKIAAVFAELLELRQAWELSKLVASRDRRLARQKHREFLVAQREASYAISTALDWTAASVRPSHATLVERRAVVVVPR